MCENIQEEWDRAYSAGFSQGVSHGVNVTIDRYRETVKQQQKERERAFEHGQEMGIRRAKERIIKLLENETLETTLENPRANYDKLVWAGIREQLIALIEGENK